LNKARRWATVGFCAAALILSAGCQSPSAESSAGQTERNRAYVGRWIDEGFNKRNLAVIDELFAERFAVNGQVVGRDGLRASMSQYLIGFPDLYVTVNDTIAEGNKVGIWYTAEGTHEGEFEGVPATGNRVKWSGFDLLSIEDEKISEARFLSDQFGLLAQLGQRLQ